jgi:hypothetical protein
MLFIVGTGTPASCCSIWKRRTSSAVAVWGERPIRLPFWLEPGALRIDHTDMGDGCFAFTLSLHHRLLGELIHQLGHFHDQPVKKEDQL